MGSIKGVKFELGLIQELEERGSNNSKAAQKIENDFTSFMQLKNKIQGSLKSTLLENNSLISKISESEKALKELGIENTSLFKAKKYSTQVDEILKSIDSKIK